MPDSPGLPISPAVFVRLRLLILSAALAPALAGCHRKASDDPASPITVSPSLPKAQRARVRASIDALFADPDAGETRAVVLLQGGRVVGERYAEGVSAQAPQPGGSLSKCVTGLLVGLLVSDGRLRLDAPAAVPAWRRAGDPRGAITPRMLLQMRSGLRHQELGEDGDAARMLQGEGRSDVAAYAEGEPVIAPAGQRSNYSSADTVVLSDVVARTLTSSDVPTERRQTVFDYLRTRLLVPARMASMVVGFDPRGTMIGATAMKATPRDWGNVGELLRNNGAVKGAQLLPRGWIAFMRRASPADPEMGAQLWLDHRNTLLPGRAPPGVFACAGAGGQFVIVSPAQRATLVRMGASGDGGSGVLSRRLANILRALPGYGPG